MFFLLYFLVYLLKALFVLPYLEHTEWLSIDIVSISVVVVLFVCCWLANPGYIRHHNPPSLLELHQNHP